MGAGQNDERKSIEIATDSKEFLESSFIGDLFEARKYFETIFGN